MANRKTPADLRASAEERELADEVGEQKNLKNFGASASALAPKHPRTSGVLNRDLTGRDD